MELVLSKDPCPLASVVFYHAQRAMKNLKQTASDAETVTLKAGEETITGEVEIAKYLCTKLNLPIYPEAHRAEIDKILSEYPSYNPHDLQCYLAFRTYLVGHTLTVADIAVYGQLPNYPAAFFRVQRWANLMGNDPFIKRFAGEMAKRSHAPKQDAAKKKVSNVKTRFAPEPSGFLHVGHAKSALASESMAKSNGGTFVLRFDDTNPVNESVEFEEKIKDDIALLALKPDVVEHTSDYIPMIMETIVEMIKKGLAFVDDIPKEEMKRLRSELKPSPNRDNSVERNLELWEEMNKGTEKGFACVVRAKINYADKNGCMRDPAIARCVKVEHQRMKTTSPVFPMYDLCCPIVDSKTGITHAMRSWEYTDRDQQYNWFIQALGLRPVEIVSFSRLSFLYTVLSKRHLRQLVKDGLASGWDDPRFPTVRGLRRRGIQPETLRQFCSEQGASRNQNTHEWDKIWAQNRVIISKSCPRVMSIAEEFKVPLTIKGAQAGVIEAPIVPTDASKGKRQLPVGPNVIIEQDDAKQLEEGKKVTLMHWGNVIVDKINKEGDKVVSVEGTWTDDKDFKGTNKINWLVEEKAVKVLMREWNYLLKVEQLKDDMNVSDYVCDVPFADTVVLCDPSLASPTVGSIWQLERRAEIIFDELPEGKLPLCFLIPTGRARNIGLPIKIQLFK